MGVLTDLVVAPLSDVPSVASTPPNERRWPWVDVKGLPLGSLSRIHCLLDGVDPSDPVAPPEWIVNPFTKGQVAVTMGGRHQKAFEVVAGDGDAIVSRVPSELVHKLARLDSSGTARLRHRWWVHESSGRDGDGQAVTPFPEDLAAAYLEEAIAMAKTAVARDEELLVWECP
jgi:hypothetical protein